MKYSLWIALAAAALAERAALSLVLFRASDACEEGFARHRRRRLRALHRGEQ